MARKFLYIVAGLVVLAMVALVVLNLFAAQLTRMAFLPSGAFEPQAAMAQDRYADPAMWISRPGKGPNDPALWLPPGTAPTPQGPRVAVFFVHPTSYTARDHWNAPLEDGEANRTAQIYVRGMATPFNANADVWAPRYRQASIGAFLTDSPDGLRALDLAYGDVAQAFDRFLAEVPPDRPIVLAGHSQGAAIVIRLLKERIAGKPLAARIVAAYPVGWPVSLAHDLPLLGLPACTVPDQTGCVASWGSFAEPAEPGKLAGGYAMSVGLDGQPRGETPILCSNPLTGQQGGSAPAEANLGTLVPGTSLADGTLTPKAVPARCDDRTGLLLIGDPPKMGEYVLPGNNYHVYDIPLFWANLRADVLAREAAWEARWAKAPR